MQVGRLEEPETKRSKEWGKEISGRGYSVSKGNKEGKEVSRHVFGSLDKTDSKNYRKPSLPLEEDYSPQVRFWL